MRRLASPLAAVLVVLGFAYLATPATASAARRTGPAGLRLIEHFEGYFPTVYADPVGVRTQCYGATGAELRSLPPVATRAQCRAQLRRSLARTYEPPVNALRLPLSQHQFDSIVSAVYNLGPGVLQRGWSLGDALRSRKRGRVVAALRLYVNAGGRPLPGLVRRRDAEAALFVRPVPLRGFPKLERVLIHRYDRWMGRVKAGMRQRMAAQVRRVRAAGRRDGWQKHRRLARYRALRWRVIR